MAAPARPPAGGQHRSSRCSRVALGCIEGVEIGVAEFPQVCRDREAPGPIVTGFGADTMLLGLGIGAGPVSLAFR